MLMLLRPPRVLILMGAPVLSQGQEYVISTFAGGGPPSTPVPGVNMALGSFPFALTVAADAMGNTFFAAFDCVFKLDQKGVVTRFAGNGRPGYSGDGGPAASAQLRIASAAGIAVDQNGNVYVADTGNYRVRKISATGTIGTIAGSGTLGFSGDGGPAISAQLGPEVLLAVDLAGNLLIADSNANRIRRVSSDGTIATVAGTGDCGFAGDGGPAAAAQICDPLGIAADSAGNIFIADYGNNRIRQISADGIMTTLAGTGLPVGFCPELCQPSSIAIDQAGNLYVNDHQTDGWWDWYLVRKISPNGAVATVAGLPCFQTAIPTPCAGDNTTATKTFLGGPVALAVDNTGNLLIADGGDGGKRRISKVSSGGAIATVVGSCGGLPTFDSPDCQMPFLGDGGQATGAQLAVPSGVAVDGAGNLFIGDYANARIRKVTPDGIITTLAGNGTFGSAGDGGPAANAQMAPYRLTLDGAGNLFSFDIPHRNIRKISSDGVINTVTYVGGNDYFVALDRASDLFIADPTNTLYAIAEVSPNEGIRRVAGDPKTCDPDGGCSGFLGDGGPATSAQLAGPQGVAVDTAGNIFIADSQNHRIRKITPDGIITTVAGSSPLPGRGGFSGDGGPAVNAQLNYPIDVAVDGAGNLYIADYENQRIRRVSPDGIISTISGDGTPGYSGDGGPATRASLCLPSALAVDGAGNIYVADSCNNAIRILRPVPRDEIHRN